MQLTREEIQTIANDAVSVCRRDVDRELIALAKQNVDNAWTEERAADIAQTAADLAVKQITEGFYMSVGKKTITIVGAMVITIVIIARDSVKEFFR